VCARPFLGVVLVIAIGLIPLAPPEHVHEVEEHGHVEFVVHRHAGGHELAHAAHDGAARTVDHQDPPVATLDQDYIVPAIARLGMPARTVASALVEPTAARRITVRGFVERLIHGPPRAPTLERGPPSTIAR
jgi:hypothetical protein